MATTSIPRRTLKLASRIYDTVHRPPEGIVVLIYHRVGASTGGQMNLDRETFRQQVEWLAETQRVISLDDAVAEITVGENLRHGVVVTFDDGTADWVDVVAPILDRHHMPATFYLTTSYPNGDAPLPDGEAPISWKGVEELHSTGTATIGSHTHSHLLLDRLDPSGIDRELDRSIELIGSHIGTAPGHFAYPKAVDPSPPAHTAVSRRFASAALAGTRPNTHSADVHRLQRSPIQAADSFEDFQRKTSGGMGFEDSVRRVLNRVRYRAATK